MPLSLKKAVRLRFASVTEYKPILREIEEPGPINARYYDDALLAIREFHSTGSPLMIRAAISRLEQLAANTENGRERAKYQGNADVLGGYMESFSDPFRPITQGLPGLFKSYRWETNGVIITGKPHVAVCGRNGRPNYLYISASKSWTSREVQFTANLLAEIVVSNVPGTKPADVEVLDCRSGHRHVGRQLCKRDREALAEMARLLRDRGLN